MLDLPMSLFHSFSLHTVVFSISMIEIANNVVEYYMALLDVLFSSCLLSLFTSISDYLLSLKGK